MRRSRWSVLTLILLAVTCAAGCSTNEDSASTPSAATQGSDIEAASGGESGTRPRIILVGAAPTSEPFASVSAKGLEQAGRDFDLETIWRGPTQPNPSDPTEQARLIENAVASKPDGLIVSDVYPDQFNPLIKSAVDDGIPVVLFSAGAEQVEKVGALAFVGNDETASGRLAGEQMGRIGSKHALLVTLPPGVPTVDTRVEGFKQGFSGEVTTLEIPTNDLSDTTKVRNLIEVELQKDDSIDGVWPIGTGIGAPVLAAYDALGDRAKEMHWGQLGLDAPTIEALKEGKYSFSTDQQQFLQGYLPAMWLGLYLRYGIEPVDSFIRTGPTLVTSDDAERLSELSAKKIR